MARLVPLNEVFLHNSEHCFFSKLTYVYIEKKNIWESSKYLNYLFKMLVGGKKKKKRKTLLIDVLTMMDKNKTEKNGYEHFSISNTL